MMHKAWSSIEEVAYCFVRSSVKFQRRKALKSSNLTQMGHFRTVTQVWIHQWLRINIYTGDPLHSRAACTQPCNVNTHSRAHCSSGARLCEQWGHGCVNNRARLCASARLCRGSPVIYSLMLLRRYALLFCNVIRQISRSHGSLNLTRNGRFRTVTQVSIHQWLRNDAQSLK